MDANAGDDDNAGTELLPFATITHAIATGGAAAIIYVLPGTYDAAHGEDFPITLLAGQRLLGDPITKGAGTEATLIIGKGAYAGINGVGNPATVVCGPSSEISGFQIDADSYVLRHAAVVIDGELAVVRENQILDSSYAAVAMTNAYASHVRNNVLGAKSYGVFLRDCPDTPLVEGNVFAGPSLAIDMNGAESNPWIHDNVFQAGSIVGIQIQDGIPRIEGNTFEAGSGSTYGAIRTRKISAMPVVRSNTFLNTLAIQVQDDGTPDLGTSGDPGLNDFSGVGGVCIQHDGTTDISAIGNTWPNDPPIMGEDIIINGSGTVILFGVPLEGSSIGRLKTTF